jgi:hypothetical protein
MDKNFDLQSTLLQLREKLGTKEAQSIALSEFAMDCHKNGRIDYLLKQDATTAKKAFGYWKSKNVFRPGQLPRIIALSSLTSNECLALAKTLIERAKKQLNHGIMSADELTVELDSVTALNS